MTQHGAYLAEASHGSCNRSHICGYWTTKTIKTGRKWTKEEAGFGFRYFHIEKVDTWLLLVAVILCGLLPSDDHHGEPQPGARCAHVRWIVGLLSLHHAQLSVGIWC